MSEFDFLKDFGRHLDRERPQENQEENWAAVAETLDKTHKPIPWIKWAIPALAGSLLLVLAIQNRRLAVQNTALRAALAQKAGEIAIEPVTPAPIPVISEKNTLASTNSPIPSENKKPLSAAPFASKFKNLLLKNNLFSNTLEGQPNIIEKENRFSEAIATTPPDKNLTMKTTGQFASLPMRKLPILEKNRMEILRPEVGTYIAPTRTLRKPEIAVIEFHGGTAVNSFEHEKGHNHTVSMGVALKMPVWRRFQFLAGVDKGFSRHKLLPGALDLSHFPTPPPPPPSMILEGIAIEQAPLTLAVGLQYQYKRWKRIAPYLSAAWLGTIAAPPVVRYDWENPTTHEQTATYSTQHGLEFHKQGAQIGVGASYAIWGRWNLAAEGLLQLQQSPFSLGTHMWRAVRIGIQYQIQ